VLGVHEPRRALASAHLAIRRRAVGAVLDLFRIRARRAHEKRGLTIAVVNFNSTDKLPVLLAAVAQQTSVEYELLVVDNASTDHAKQYLRSRSDIRAVFLPVNIGHGLALDLAFLLAGTDTVVVLDADAFPIDPGWLPAVLEPLGAGAKIAGAYFQRAFVHPCFLAMRRQTFLRNRLSFVPIGRRGPDGIDAPGGLFMDVGEALSHGLSVRFGTKSVHKIAPTSTRGPGPLGTVFGGVVYHNFFSTHGETDWGRESAEAWADAVRRYVESAPRVG
jgi:glycosyltransferase involved in cell wall biosynthesis